MKMTLDIDDTVLSAARVIAEQRSISLGKAVSQMALRGLQTTQFVQNVRGFPLLPHTGTDHVITDELVRRYRDG